MTRFERVGGGSANKMIYAERSQLSKYYGISEHLDTAIRFLEKCDLSSLVQGRNDVDGENVYINRFDYETMPESEAFFEAHEQYADIHLLLSGEEKIGVSDPNVLEEFERDAATDYIGYRGPAESYNHMTKDKVLIAFPYEAHMVKVQFADSVKVEKAVVKVKI